MLFATNIAIDQEVIGTTITVGLLMLCLHSSHVHQHSTFNRSRAQTLLWGTDFQSRPSTNLSRI